MRARGHELVLAVQKGGGLVKPAKKAGFVVYELDFQKRRFIPLLFELSAIVKCHQIQVINTHSSVDAWTAGVVGKLLRRHLIRTRHLSTPIKGGLNGYLLYNFLASQVVTTCEEVVKPICKSAKLPAHRCCSVPTGLDPSKLQVDPKEVAQFREKLGIKESDICVGTLCVIRGWKGIAHLIGAAKHLEEHKRIKWVVVGTGPSEGYFRQFAQDCAVDIIFTGHIAPPFTALAAFDIFALLSWSHEGVSQASLQAAYMKKPLVTTATGGLKEVCLDQKTGFLVDCYAPDQVAKAVKRLADSQKLRQQMGEAAHNHVSQNFLFDQTLDAMERAVLAHPSSHQTSQALWSPPK
ncbi:MAG: D-inositol-3-phosphate glycosyltransferase [Chlamydiales bacterium]|nr:D-inositol-3-phosphate glycosyltransferase [Chlamydiales bacterium]MCH9635181.1 D-inositol-3-phosphate glycosyltransferase [Chlamydiales bacterium]